MSPLNLLENVDRCVVDINAIVELTTDTCESQPRVGADHPQALDGVDRLLHRTGNLDLHHLGAGVGPTHVDVHRGNIDLREKINREAKEEDKTEQDKRRDAHRHRNRTGNC